MSWCIDRDNQSRLEAKPGLKINIYFRGITQTRTKDPCPADDRWVGTFSPGWYYQPGLKGPLVPGVKNAEANAKLRHRFKICSLVLVESDDPDE